MSGNQLEGSPVAPQSNPPSRLLLFTLWTGRILLAALFAAAAAAKLSGQPMMVEEFSRVGLGQWLRFFTAGLELVGAIALVIPSFTLYGAGVLLAVVFGAFVAQIMRIHIDWIHTVVVAAMLAGIVWLQTRSTIVERTGAQSA